MTPRSTGSDQTLFVAATVIFGLAGAVWAAALLVWLQPLYWKMFRDFGSALPAATVVCLAPWFPLLAALPAVGAASTLSRHMPRDARILILVAGALAGVAHLALFFVAMYLPIFQLAADVK